MSGRETIGVVAVAFMFNLAAYIAIVLWVVGAEGAGTVDRVTIAIVGIFSVPVSTAGTSAFVVTQWKDHP